MKPWQDVGRQQAVTVVGSMALSVSGIHRWSAALCGVLAVALWVGPYLARPDTFYDDVAHHVFWLYQLAEPSLFPNDLTIAYFHTSAPWGYRAVYCAVVPFIDALTATKIVAALLLAAAVFLAWKIGRISLRDRPDEGGLLAAVAFIALLAWSQQKDLMPPIGFQRTFALPLLLLTLWALLAGKYRWVGISWVGAALFYPVTLPVQGLTVAVVFLRDLAVNRTMPSHWLFNAVAGSAALALAAYGTPIPLNVGPAFTFEQAIQMIEFGQEGRLSLFPPGLVTNWFTGHRTGLGWSPGVLALIGASAAFVSIRGSGRSIPFPAWAMALIGLGLWLGMRLFPSALMFGLYLPNRHSRWAIGAFGILAIAAALSCLLSSSLPSDRSGECYDGPGSGSASVLRRRWIAVLAPVLVAVLLLPNALAVSRRPVDRDLERVYEFLTTLPKDTLVAAHPDLANFVPVRARRSVLASTEVSMAWMESYYAQMKPRMVASLRAAYATRIEEVDAELSPYGVDVMLTGPRVWEDHRTFSPFRELESELMARGAGVGFVLRVPPPDRVIFRSGDYYVIRVGACEEARCP